ncbi:hypothetical protein IV203_018675 [Nitzschia inconspicua]|uniref:Uncharacterized protein n=1 Tax=Nitzschia inconspicua TaxID=303405 RepID=A0A9K3M2A7_9STRA|nr:hypothetical protein IV203_018675 [Nitzschia inconspicua]
MMPATSAESPHSRSIPINSNNTRSRRLARAEEALEREVAMADYVDFCFASRLVHGMQQRQNRTHDVSLRYENQALIDHIIATRQSREAFPTSESRSRTAPERRDSTEKLSQAASQDDSDTSQHSGDEDMIFDMEL